VISRQIFPQEFEVKVIIGPDVSVYEDDPATPQGIDFTRMREAANFVIVRAGQSLEPDTSFNNNWSHAKAAGLPRGSYWLFDSRSVPKQQAELWVQLLGGDLGELPLFIDIEENYGGLYHGWGKWVEFLERLKELTGNKEMGIYTAFAYWKDNAPDPLTEAANLEYFHKYTLWIAHYGVATPSVPKPWGADEWVFWQFTNSDDGKTYGAESHSIDLSFFNGDGTAFTQRYNLPAPEQPHDYYPPGIPPGIGYRVNTTALNIRAGSGPSFPVIGSLKNGDIVEGLDINADGSWTQIRRADGLTGWCASRYLIKLDSPPPPAPPPPPPPPPPVPTGVKYRVAPTALNIRAGPGTSFTVTGSLKNGDIVDGLGINADGSWTQIRRADGLTGWCASRYLVKLGG
jgi:lysozyme